MSGELRTDTRHFARGINDGDRYAAACGADLTRLSVATTPVLDWAAVTCPDCLGWLAKLAGEEEGVGTPTPHTPPYMNEKHDGIFEFTDVHIEGARMEVVPQLSGNVEITVGYGPDGGYMFTLHHLDRADLIRALLHDFHYSPEKGGPNGD